MKTVSATNHPTAAWLPACLIAASEHRYKSYKSAVKLAALGLLMSGMAGALTYGLLPGSPVEAAPSSSNSQVATVQPLPPTCQNQSSQLSALVMFDDCPSFELDFSQAKDGLFETNRDFNIVDGKPEANNEAQYYTSDAANIGLRNGALVLTAKNKPMQGYKYTSARIDTKGKHNFLYGRIVVRAKLPKSVGTWPAIWMLSSDEKYRDQNPAYSPNHDLADGELDIAEAVGTEPNKIYTVAHSQSSWEGNRDNYFATTYVETSDTAFHDYELRWTPTSLAYFVDGKQVYSIAKSDNAGYQDWPYDQPYYLIINLALGGSWGGRDTAHFPGDGVDASALPASLHVQSIRVYPYKQQ